MDWDVNLTDSQNILSSFIPQFTGTVFICYILVTSDDLKTYETVKI